jgi:methylenetetrahydrofolate reductase (NADPH)
MEPLFRTITELCTLNPDFISCTYGAGGSTRDRTLQIVEGLRSRCGVGSTAHFTCVGSTVAELRDWLAKADAAGVDNIMALRGDPPKGQEKFQAVAGGLTYANELVAMIRKEYPRFGIGVAGYPETHQEAPSAEIDLANLKRKVDAGADAIFTQLFYDNADFFAFRDRCAAAGIKKPIIAGLLPILNYAQVKRITSLCKARLPIDLVSQLEACQGDDAAQMDIGIEHATRQVEGLLRTGVAGLHFYVLNKAEAARRILGNVQSLLPVAAR